MKLRTTMTAAILAISASAGADVHVCTPCDAGTYAPAGATTCTSCPINTYSGIGEASCTSCPANSTTLGGTGKASADDCECDDLYYKREGQCTHITKQTLNYFTLIDNSDKPGLNSCKEGTIEPGTYRIVVGGGNSNAQGGQLTYNFKLKEQATYSLCAGGNGTRPGSCGEISGGAGSYLQLTTVGNNKDYYFAAGGGSGHAGGNGGPGGGGIGGGASTLQCGRADGASVGPYRGAPARCPEQCTTYYDSESGGWYESCINYLLNRGNGAGLGAPNLSYVCGSSEDSGSGGGGGGNGGGPKSPKGSDITVNTILQDGSYSTFKGRLANNGSYMPGVPAKSMATHATNVEDPDTCNACAKLYKLK